jgi:hypothetical protein
MITPGKDQQRGKYQISSKGKKITNTTYIHGEKPTLINLS